MPNRERHTHSLLQHAFRLVVAASVVLLLSCSAPRRLAVLLARHPELHRDSAVVVSAVKVIEADSAAVDFSIADIQSLGNPAPDTDSLGQSITIPQSLTIETKTGAVAEIRPVRKAAPTGEPPSDREKSFRLSVATRADTIVIRDTVIVPSYVTRVVKEDKIVYRQSPRQRFFSRVGITGIVLLILFIVVKVALWLKNLRLL